MKKPLITATLLLLTGAVWAQNYSSRFGTLFINEDHVLSFNGKPVQPRVQGNNSLTYIRKFEIGQKDVVLIQDDGGTACPAMYHFVTLSKAGAKATPAFGSCLDLIKVSRSGDTIRVTMPGFAGQFEGTSAVDRAIKERQIYSFTEGKLSKEVWKPSSSKWSSSFNPFTTYFPTRPLPAKFAHFGAFVLSRPEGSPGLAKASGAVYVDSSSPRTIPLSVLKIKPPNLSFSTSARSAERFTFDGKFLQSGDIGRFSVTPGTPKKVVVLKGTLRRYVKGRLDAATPVSFYSHSGAG